MNCPKCNGFQVHPREIAGFRCGRCGHQWLGVDLVIRDLKSITFDAFHQRDRMGYFSTLYWLTSERIKQAIEDGDFDDNAFVDTLDVAFAGKYFQACSAYRWYGLQGIASPSWQYAFQIAQDDVHLIFQHLIVGLNAHILVDLGLTVAETCSRLVIKDFHDDFMKISDILAEVISEAEGRVSQNTDLIMMINDIFPTQPLTEFGLRAYRERAWDFALELAYSPYYRWSDLINQQEMEAIEIGNSFLSSDEVEELIIRILGILTENTQDVQGNIARLLNPHDAYVLANVEELKKLAFEFTARGPYEKGLEIDEELAEKCPTDPIVHYNLACSYSLLNRVDDSLQSLAKALWLGYEDFEHMLADADLENIRDDPRFWQLIN